MIIARDDYWDKVYACWLGKNRGGTLGAPLEKLFAEAEPFAVDWYPDLRVRGIPNDDLEMQLIWFKAVEEQGFTLTSHTFVRYGLDHIGYNWDEYGLAKANLRLGLLPPVSGHYNNWFVDCMGAPIRSEFWSCLAPGVPSLAVRYAFEDASVDHAGGEGVWGEVFNAAVGSAAFVERNPSLLLDIGLLVGVQVVARKRQNSAHRLFSAYDLLRATVQEQHDLNVHPCIFVPSILVCRPLF